MLIDTSVSRPTTLERSYSDTSASAALPSGLEGSSTPSTRTASMARKTSLDMIGSPVSLQRHDDADEVDAEGWLECHDDTHLAGDLLSAGRRYIQRVSGESLILDHSGQEGVESRRERRTHARVVKPADVGICRRTHPVFGVIHDAPRWDGREGFTHAFGRDALEHTEPVLQYKTQDIPLDQLLLLAAIGRDRDAGYIDRLVCETRLHRDRRDVAGNRGCRVGRRQLRSVGSLDPRCHH